MPVTFPELTVGYDCAPDSFAKIIGIYRCANMDAWKLDIIDNDKPRSIYFTGESIAKAIDKLSEKKII